MRPMIKLKNQLLITDQATPFARMDEGKSSAGAPHGIGFQEMPVCMQCKHGDDGRRRHLFSSSNLTVADHV